MTFADVRILYLIEFVEWMMDDGACGNVCLGGEGIIVFAEDSV